MKKENKKAPPFTGKTDNTKIPTKDGNVDARLHTGGGRSVSRHLLYSWRRRVIAVIDFSIEIRPPRVQLPRVFLA